MSIETKFITFLFTVGHIMVKPNTLEHRIARKLYKQFKLIETEDMYDGVVVYRYRINTQHFEI